jgi:hypothetical protein
MKEATIDDLRRFIEPAKWFHAQTNIAGEFHRNHFLYYWEEAFRTETGRVFYSGDDEVVEAIAVRTGLAQFDMANVATVAFWYTKDDREGLSGGLLFNRVLAELEKAGIKRISISALIDFKFEQTTWFLESAGFKAKEVLHQREVS